MLWVARWQQGVGGLFPSVGGRAKRFARDCLWSRGALGADAVKF